MAKPLRDGVDAGFPKHENTTSNQTELNFDALMLLGGYCTEHHNVREQSYSSYLVNTEETECHNVATPGGGAVAAAGARRDAASIKDNSNIVVSFPLTSLVERLWGIHCCTQVKACTVISILCIFFYSFLYRFHPFKINAFTTTSLANLSSWNPEAREQRLSSDPISCPPQSHK